MKKNQLYDYYSSIEAKLGDQFYLFDRSRFISNIRTFKEAFSAIYPSVVLSHSYKTNYTPSLCKVAMDEGLYAEVVSGLEYELALRVGYPPEKIIFNGPIKKIDELRVSLHADSIVNIDHLEEVRQVVAIAEESPDRQVNVGVRCNLNLGGGTDRSRFGLSEDNGELNKAFELLRKQQNIHVAGIHVHSSAVRSVASYRKRADFTLQIIKEYFPDHPPEYIDLGGGFKGMLPRDLMVQLGEEQTDFGAYAESLCTPINGYFEDVSKKPKIFLEPGLAILANVFQLCTKVLAVKHVGGRSVAILSGSVHTVKPTGHLLNMPVSRISPCHESYKDGLWDLTGYTCMEHDLLFEGFKGDVKVGDYFVFDHVGAYTTVFKPPFIKASPPIIEVNDVGFDVIRDMETIEQFICTYRM